MGLSGAAKMCFIAALVSLAAATMLFIKCDTRDIAGVNKPYVNRSVKYYQKTCTTYTGTGYANKKKLMTKTITTTVTILVVINSDDDSDDDEEEKE